MTLQQLTYLVTVAECGNITEAAQRLFITQPSLSASIHNLEKEMGITAFTRSNKGVVVTREGEQLLSFARMLLEQADIMKDHCGNGSARMPKFSVSCQYYSFAVNAFVDVVKTFDADQYNFILRETQTGGKEQLNQVIDTEITKVVKKQKELGFYIITDGEFRRTYWHLDFMWGLDGVSHEQTGNGVAFNGEMALLEDTFLTGKIKAKPHPFVEYYKFLKQFEDETTAAKYTIPAPAQTFQQMIIPANFERTRKFYAANEELIHDIGIAYQNIIKQFYDAGCRNLQLDDCTWGAIVGTAAKQRYQSLGIKIEDVKAQLLAVNYLALDQLVKVNGFMEK